MSLKKVAVIFGTRPEFIKLAPVIHALQKQDEIETHICFTGQHDEMVKSLFPVFNIQPDVNLELMTHGQSLSEFAGRAMKAFDEYLNKYNPDYLVVQGDTSTVLISSLVGFFHKKTVFHVEAGLRTFDKYSPFPEEMNRVLTTRIANFHFAPTQMAYDNLVDEKIPEDQISITGNTGIDAVLQIAGRLSSGELEPNIDPKLLEQIDQYQGKMTLITAHRRENFGSRIRNIFTAILNLAGQYPDMLFVYPVHLNPNVQVAAKELLTDRDNIYLTDPQDYLNFIYLMNRAHIILTDSGGIQEEAPSLNKPVLVLRTSTERQEGVNAGVLELVGTETEDIKSSFIRLMDEPERYQDMASRPNPFGDGQAAERIVKLILAYKQNT